MRWSEIEFDFTLLYNNDKVVWMNMVMGWSKWWNRNTNGHKPCDLNDFKIKMMIQWTIFKRNHRTLKYIKSHLWYAKGGPHI